ncbi:hypothetical protein [Burkholderia sp. SIMBA_024]|uniref:hypothetical protein n=1 Tax=Burkholderia sp. SIMBA_024 TaxID=3085768 RepID=UPI00397D3C4F
MDRTPINLSASSKAALIDGDITHIARVMRLSLQGDLAGPILAPAYWRERLYKLLRFISSCFQCLKVYLSVRSLYQTR